MNEKLWDNLNKAFDITSCPMPEIPDDGDEFVNQWCSKPGNQFALGNQHTPETKAAMSEYRSKCRWYNDGVNQVFTLAQPDGFVQGRLPFDTSNINHQGSNNPRAVKWRLTFEDGSTIITCGLRSWCASQPNINYSGLYYAWQHNNSYKHITEIVKL